LPATTSSPARSTVAFGGHGVTTDEADGYGSAVAEDSAALRPVVVVDDSSADREALARAYRRVAPDQRIVFCSTADEAIDEIRATSGRPSSDQPAFAILDVNMPDRGGLELLGQLREEFPLLPVVMLSGSARPEDRRAAYLVGAAGFFVKPMGIDALAEVLDSIHRYWQQHAHLAAEVT
jgi:CheY-like chemotaxis protein